MPTYYNGWGTGTSWGYGTTNTTSITYIPAPRWVHEQEAFDPPPPPKPKKKEEPADIAWLRGRVSEMCEASGIAA